MSLLQRQHPIVLRNLQNISSVDRAVTVITLAEQVQGRLATFRRARNEAESSRMLQFLLQTIEFYQTIQVLPYDDKSAVEFERLRQLKIRIGTQDLRIAAIALSNQATVVTRNYRDFERVPELNITDWTVA
ncbi:MAG: type II toxin-antitoxin system VapC family toxin [Caldilineaceae bacterium]